MDVKIVTTARIKKPRKGMTVGGWFFSCGLGYGQLTISAVNSSTVFFTDGRKMKMADYIRNELESASVKKNVTVMWSGG